jgi:hypothetical protein
VCTSSHRVSQSVTPCESESAVVQALQPTALTHVVDGKHTLQTAQCASVLVAAAADEHPIMQLLQSQQC